MELSDWFTERINYFRGHVFGYPGCHPETQGMWGARPALKCRVRVPPYILNILSEIPHAQDCAAIENNTLDHQVGYIFDSEDCSKKKEMTVFVVLLEP